MLNLFIRYTSIIFCGNHIYHKLLHIQPKKKDKLLFFNIFTSIFITIFCYLLSNNLQYIILPTLILINFIYFACTTPITLETTFTSIVISYGICYSFFFLAGCIVYLLLCIPFFVLFNHTMHYLCSQLLIALVQCILCILPFRFKRLKKGMPFLYNNLISRIGMFISFIILLSAISISSLSTDTSIFITKYYLIPIPFILLFALFIFMWWRNQIQQSYLFQLRERDYERLEKQFKLCQEKLSDLEKENQTLSKLIHRDNKLIPSMQLALHQLIEIEIKEATSEKVLKECNSLLVQLEQEMADRNGIVMKLSCSDKILEPSGISSIDYLLTYMHQKCLNENIVFKVAFKKDISEMLQDVITETNCVTILADLLENAIIAIKSTCKNGHILLEIGKGKTFYEIHVWDDGIPFTKEVLYHLGKKRYTTHKKDGGSGIGIMNTYSLLQASHASLIINEQLDSYSKKISIIFDQKQQYQLLTKRPKEDIEYLKQRNHLIIIEK